MTSTVRELIEEYTRRYVAHDSAGVTDLCLVPFLAIRGGEAINLADRAATVAHFDRIMDAYATAGYASFSAVDLDVRELGDRAAFVTVRWHAVDAAGAVARESTTTYHLLKTESGWRFVSYTNHF